MREYAQVWPGFWSGDTGRALAQLANEGDLQPQRVAFHLMTCGSGTFSGLYYLPLPLLIHQLGGITLEGAQKALRSLSALGFAHYDEQSEQIWVVQAATYNIGPNPSLRDNRVLGLQRELEEKRKSPFHAAFLEHYAHLFPSPAGGVRSSAAARGSRGGPKGLPTPSQGGGVSDPDPSRSEPDPIRAGDRARARTSSVGSRPPPEQRAEDGAEDEHDVDDNAPLTPSLLEQLFAEGWTRLRKHPPPAAELDQLEAFADRINTTALEHDMPAVPLVRTALEQWAGGKLNGIEKRAPLQCFAVAWGEVIESIAPPPPPPQPPPTEPSAAHLQRERGEAMRHGNTARYNELTEQLRAMNGGRHAAAR